MRPTIPTCQDDEIELAYDDAQRRQIATGDGVSVRSNGTSLSLRARVNRALAAGRLGRGGWLGGRRGHRVPLGRFERFAVGCGDLEEQFLEVVSAEVAKARFEKHLDEANDYFRRNGGKTIFIGRYVSVVGTFMPFAAVTMPLTSSYRHVLPANGTTLRTTVAQPAERERVHREHLLDAPRGGRPPAAG